MSGEPRPTLMRPPPEDPNKAPIENVLEVTKLDLLGPDIFTNARRMWHPPGARGIFGGAMIAQCLAAGQKTVPADFFVHSCHCYFLLAGSSEIPILFHVERVRDGRSFATRTVQARQRGKCIFTVTMSFARSGSGGAAKNSVRHSSPFPQEEKPPTEEEIQKLEAESFMGSGPFQSYKVKTIGASGPPETQSTRMWVRARGKIQGSHAAHLEALGYMSDSYFIGTVSRIHGVWRWPFEPSEVDSLPAHIRQQVRKVCEFESIEWDVEKLERRPKLGMMVSLDHSIYFHEPEKIRADRWMLCEMESPWAGDGRGVVTQRIFAEDGTLLATCFQEGVVRLRQGRSDGEKEKKAKL